MKPPPPITNRVIPRYNEFANAPQYTNKSKPNTGFQPISAQLNSGVRSGSANQRQIAEHIVAPKVATYGAKMARF